MGLSPEAIENDKNSGLPLIPVKEIYADKSFNCRGHITASDVVDLVRDTAKRGLVEPIIVRKLWDSETIQATQGFKYSLVAGFRRHFSYRINEADVIPAIVRMIDSDFDARDVNAVENLQRQDLNILQEANSIRHYLAASWSREAIGKRVSKSPGWVQAREELLAMPEEIQIAAAQGYLTQEDLKLLYKQRGNRDEMMRLAGVIRDRRKLGLKKNILSKVKVKASAFERKQRRPADLQEILNVVQDMCKGAKRDKQITVGQLFSDQGNSFATRLLAWGAGNIPNVDVHTALKQLSIILECEYEIPDFTENGP